MKLNIKKILMFLFALYIILPDYFRILGVSSQLVDAFLIILIYLFCSRNKRITKMALKFALLFFIPYAIVLVIHGEIFVIVRIFIERVALLLILSSILNTEKDIHNMINIVLNFAVFEGITGIIHSLLDFNIFSLISNTKDVAYTTSDYGAATQYRVGIPRIEGSFSHAITYGIYVSMMACLCLFMYQRTKKKKYFAIYGLMVINLFLTISRMPIMVFILSQIIYLFLMNPKRAFDIVWKIIGLSMIIVIIIRLAFPELWNALGIMTKMVSAVFSLDGMSGLISFNQESAFSYRSEMIRVIPEMLKGHFAWGIGAVGMKDFQFLINGTVQRSIDNQYLYFLVLYGVLGLVSVLAWIFGLLLFDRGTNKRGAILERFSTYRNLMLFIYAVNLFAVATMEEYKLITVILSIAVADVVIRRNNLKCKNIYALEQ